MVCYQEFQITADLSKQMSDELPGRRMLGSFLGDQKRKKRGEFTVNPVQN